MKREPGREPELARKSIGTKPERASRTRACSIRYRGTRHTCALARNHDGPHIARGFWGRTVAEWESGLGALASSAPESRISATQGPEPTEAVETIWGRFVSAVPPFHDLVFLIFLVAFIGFAIQWALELSR